MPPMPADGGAPIPPSAPDANQQMPMDDNTPPMEDDGMEGGMEEESMGGMDDTDGENTDPKKEIQSMTGSLSQKLRAYNSQMPQPDVDLNKYVAGMINKQAVNGLNPEDVEAIIAKLQHDEDTDDDVVVDMEGDNGGQLPMPQGGQPQQPAPQQNMPMESIDRRRKIDELFQQLTQSEDDEPVYDKQITKGRKSYSKKPFMSPRFR